MKLTPIGKMVLTERYLQKNNGRLEEPEELFQRVAHTVAQAEFLYSKFGTTKATYFEEQFLKMLLQLDFLPNSPTLLNAGKPDGQLAACFVLPIENSSESIFETLKHAAIIHNYGGGTGFAFNKIAPANWFGQSENKLASGPVSYIQLFNHATEIVKQGGVRPGANMATININHPAINDFISCKKNNYPINNFNLSVAITDEFMHKVEQNELFVLRFNGKAHKKISARELFRNIAANAWENGEPGVIFIDQINRFNPTPALGKIETTNPCGEQPLLPYEGCNLGSINLVNMTSGNKINWHKLRETIKNAVRFLDNVIDVNKLPIPEIKKTIAQNRKIGLGVMGFANLLQILEIPYHSIQSIKLAEAIMSFIQTEAKYASFELAQERGCFPNIQQSIYQNQLRRNATCTTVAPTGTISSIAGVSPGIEPCFALAYERNILNKTILEINPFFIDKVQETYSPLQVNDIIYHIEKFGNIANLDIISRNFKNVFISAPEIAPIWHIRVQAAFQKHCDNAVSKTVNLPESATISDVEKVFLAAFKYKCKGVTVYRIKSRSREAINIGRCNTMEINNTDQFC